MPTIVCWPGRIKPHESTALLTQVDLLASLGNLTGAPVVSGIDSENYLNAWLGETDNGREILLEESLHWPCARSMEIYPASYRHYSNVDG